MSASKSSKFLTVEKDTPLSESFVWDLRRESDKPITNDDSSLTNAFIACRYARLILSIINDWKEYLIAQGPVKLDSPAGSFVPVYVIEVGAGSGKLGYLILKKLWELRDFWPDFSTCLDEGYSETHRIIGTSGNKKENKKSDKDCGGIPICPFKYVLTEAEQRNVDFWKSHDGLQQFIKLGLLDCGVFDAEENKEIYLQESKQILSNVNGDSGNSNNKSSLSVAIFNGVISAMKQDSYQIRHGELCRGYCTTIVPFSDSKISLQMMPHVRWEWKYKKVNVSQLKPGSHDSDGNISWMGKILAYYKSYFSERGLDGSFLIPTGGINAIRKLESICNGKLIVIAWDAAFNDAEELIGIRDPGAVPGSLSFLVNLHAIGLYTNFHRKGLTTEKPISDAPNFFALSTDHLERFKCSCFVLTPNVNAELTSFEELRLQWEDGIKNFGVAEFLSLQQTVKENLRSNDLETPGATLTTSKTSTTPSLRLVLTLLRLSEYDPEVFHMFRRTVVDKCPYASSRTQHDIRVDILRISENYYHLPNSTADVAFELGRVMMGLKEFLLAIRFFQESQKNFGEHHINWYNMGICYRYINNMEKALNCFDRSLELQPQYLEAIRWKTMVENELDTKGMK